MATQTGSYDFKASNDARKTATSYITDISNGVYVHSQDTPDDPTDEEANGVRITDEIDIIRQGKSVLNIDEDILIGASDSANLKIAPEGILATGYDNSQYLELSSSGAEIEGNITQSLGSKSETNYRPGIYVGVSPGGKVSFSKTTSITTFAPSGTICIIQSGRFVANILASSNYCIFPTPASSKTNCSVINTDNTYYKSFRINPNAFTITGGTSTSYTSSATIPLRISTDTTAVSNYLNVEIIYTYNSTPNTITCTVSLGLQYNGEYLLEYYNLLLGSINKPYTINAPFMTYGTRYNDDVPGGFSSSLGSQLYGSGNYQTVIGKYNTKDTNNTYAFIIGKGTSHTTRSNALTVDWSGNVNIPSGATYKVDGSALLNKYTRSSTGDLEWTNTTDGDAKVITKSALAFWNGNFNGSGSNLSKCSDGTIIGTDSITSSGEANKIPKIKSDGVLELRKYIDMHDTGSSQDYDVRITCGTTTGSDGGAPINITCGSFKINSNTVDDFVIESGTSGIWTYRKWKNGTLELFGQYSGAPTGSSHYSTINSFYAYRVEGITLPSSPGFTNANYVVSANWKIGSGFAIDSGQVASRAKTSFTEYAIASSGSQSSVVINMHVIGKWK